MQQCKFEYEVVQDEEVAVATCSIRPSKENTVQSKQDMSSSKADSSNQEEEDEELVDPCDPLADTMFSLLVIQFKYYFNTSAKVKL